MPEKLMTIILSLGLISGIGIAGTGSASAAMMSFSNWICPWNIWQLRSESSSLLFRFWHGLVKRTIWSLEQLAQ